ncbi:hypothetical protein Tco_1278698, partial [Tanacetum coccineum]
YGFAEVGCGGGGVGDGGDDCAGEVH